MKLRKKNITFPLKKKKENTYKKQNNEVKLIAGTMDVRNDNFGFFIPDDKDLEDIFVHKNNFNGAVHKDKVLVRTGSFRGRKEAFVEKITARGVTEVIGIADISRRFCKVLPFSRDIRTPILCKKFEGISDGDVVMCAIDKYPENSSEGYGHITKKICRYTDTNADNLIVLNKYNLTRDFPEKVNEEAEKIHRGLQKGFDNKKGETDFRKLFTVTIDGETARDFDDAISVEETDNGFILYVHIADVSRYVEKGSSIDQEAVKRGTSVYFPQFAVPMLPEVLSNDKCSLVPNMDRYTVTAKITMDRTGNPIKFQFYRSIIQSDYRLTYSYVNKVLSKAESPYSEELGKFIIVSSKLANLMTDRRFDRGYIDFESPEAKFIFDAEGNVADIISTERGFSERMIELFMICANEAAAKFLDDNKVDSIYRIHGEPDSKKIEGWVQVAKMFGLSIPPMEFPVTNEIVGNLARIAADSKYADILSTMLIRTMMRAEYSVENQGHFGLNSVAYTHFTSPIRRYPDLLVHRALLDKLGLGPVHETLDELKILAPELSKLERQAEDAEYEITAFKKIYYLNMRLDEIYDAYINRVTQNGFFIYVEKVMMGGFIDFATVDFDTFYTDDFSATGKHTGEVYKVGDKIRVVLYSASIFLLQANFCFDKRKKTLEKKKKHKII